MNLNILGLAALFWIMETDHFGWNFTLGSDAELICDGIVVLLVALSFVAWSKPA